MRRTAILFLGAMVLLTGCSGEQNEVVVGKWTNGSHTLTFTKDGNFTSAKENKDGKWETLGTFITLTANGQETKCGYATMSPTHLVMQAKWEGDDTCTYLGEYWRLDIPAEARSSVVSYSCNTTGEKVGLFAYASPFVVEADEKYKYACFGRTSEGCQIVGSGHAHTNTVSVLKRYSTGQAEYYGIQSIDDKLSLTLMQTKECDRFACSFNGYINLGACTRQNG